MTIHVIALAALGQGLSGGDRLFIEFSRRWSKKHRTVVYVWEEGEQMCKRESLFSTKDLIIKVIKVGQLFKLGFLFTYLFRIILGIKLGLTLKTESGDMIYSASEFWMDSIPAYILKVRSPGIIWAAAWYQTAPNPITGFSGGRYRLHALAYWLVQLPIKPLISHVANVVLINNQSEKKQFKKFPNLKKVVVIGAVDTQRIIKYIKTHQVVEKKKYLGIFQGRFHPQKGVVELVEIWSKVVEKIPSAKLGMIGDGPLKNEVINKISQTKLQKNIDLLGYVSDGEKKYALFNNSAIVLHPALYDSGGMASAEAMAFGLPCIGFDLESYKSYYPQGMIKVPMNDKTKFAQQIISLSQNKALYKKYSVEAKQLILDNWSWDNRAEEVLSNIMNV